MKKELVLGFFMLLTICCTADSKCEQSCYLALASYYVRDGAVLSYIALYLNASMDEIVAYNNATITNKDNLPSGKRIHVPFSCDCINGEFLGHVFTYHVMSGDTYYSIASRYYANLTTVEWLQKFNSYQATSIPETAVLNVTINCSCGDSSVSKDYGLFETYPLRPSDTLASIANRSGVGADLLRRYNPNSNFSAGSGLVYIPAKDKNGNFVPMELSTGLGSEVIAGISVAGVVGILLLSSCICIEFYRKKKAAKITPLRKPSQAPVCTRNRCPQPQSPASPETNCSATTSIIVHKSVEFSYEELAKATDNFSLANKIGQGGFGAVYYAELRGEKAAIKKMDMKASKEFLAELRVLTHVHHLNLVRLIGYCTERSLFLVYEFIENGNLSQHLHSSEREPLPWSRRMQIALDSARGLEYIHEHTVPIYIHRDIKSANILIDNDYCAKVADFGLTKLTQIGSMLPLSGLVGTFGYMPPEYAEFGNVSPKVDVYAFGVVLYELISAKAAVINTNEVITESVSLVALFREVLTQPDAEEGLRKMIDTRLQEKYPFGSVFKLAQLAKACTQVIPELRPSMRSVVVALMALSYPTEDWDAESFYEFS